MADRTKIEWTDATWNPFRGCSRISEGCRNCYAERMAARFAGEGQPYHGFVRRGFGQPHWTGWVANRGVLQTPLLWRKPRRIFVNSMSDTFHESAASAWVAEVFGTMIAAHYMRGHTFQVLTKRAHNMSFMLNTPAFWDAANQHARDILNSYLQPAGLGVEGDGFDPLYAPPGIWLGVSVEHQNAAYGRVPDLIETPATVRFLSCEPLLGPITLKHEWLTSLHWVIVGGESGPGARPMHPDWVRSIRDQCAAAGVPFFFKQWGAWQTVYDRDDDDPDWRRCPREEGNNARYLNLEGGSGLHGERVVFVRRQSKKTSGRLLDGITHDALPDFQPGRPTSAAEVQHG